jgi:hypothetical protein
MRLIYLLLPAIVFLSCDFQNTLEVDLPAEKEKLVVNCFFSADSVWEVRVFSSKQVLAAEPDRVIQNASVVVTDGSRHFSCTYNPKYLSYRSMEHAEVGKKYALEVSAPGFATVTSSINVPEPIQILEVTSTLRPDPEFAGNLYRTFDITFKDAPGQSNYYAMAIFASSYSRVPPFSQLDPLPRIERPLDPTFSAEYYEEFYFDHAPGGYGTYNLLFNDRMFDGKKYTFKVDVFEIVFPDDTLNIRPLEYQIYLKTLSEPYYNYRVTYNKQKKTRDDPFAQPVQVFGNIENGYGIFAGYSQSMITYKVR